MLVEIVIALVVDSEKVPNFLRCLHVEYVVQW